MPCNNNCNQGRSCNCSCNPNRIKNIEVIDIVVIALILFLAVFILC